MRAINSFPYVRFFFFFRDSFNYFWGLSCLWSLGYSTPTRASHCCQALLLASYTPPVVCYSGMNMSWTHTVFCCLLAYFFLAPDHPKQTWGFISEISNQLLYRSCIQLFSCHPERNSDPDFFILMHILHNSPVGCYFYIDITVCSLVCLKIILNVCEAPFFPSNLSSWPFLSCSLLFVGVTQSRGHTRGCSSPVPTKCGILLIRALLFHREVISTFFPPRLASKQSLLKFQQRQKKTKNLVAWVQSQVIILLEPIRLYGNL